MYAQAEAALQVACDTQLAVELQLTALQAQLETATSSLLEQEGAVPAAIESLLVAQAQLEELEGKLAQQQAKTAAGEVALGIVESQLHCLRVEMTANTDEAAKIQELLEVGG